MPIGNQDYEYARAGTCNIFVAVEPRGERRLAQVTARRTKIDFVRFVCRLLRHGYATARKIHLVLDNLNTHCRESFEEVLGAQTAAALLRRSRRHLFLPAPGSCGASRDTMPIGNWAVTMFS